MVLKHAQNQIDEIYVHGDKNVVFSCAAVMEMQGSVSLRGFTFFYKYILLQFLNSYW